MKMPFVGSEGFHFQDRGATCSPQVRVSGRRGRDMAVARKPAGRLLATTASGNVAEVSYPRKTDEKNFIDVLV
ncbi:MAG: hypothetical protein DMG05_05255 [Acidobacteria bacterium]|nr:MAG: hypothetical protein DMG05_05255 [Acidobacteriota bacterium]